jgi:phosphatidylglycerophosphatase C
MSSSQEPFSNSVVAVAAFDFDKTLSTRDCVLPFLVRVTPRRRLAGFLKDLPVVLFAAAGRDRDRVKALVTRRCLVGIDKSEIDAVSESFASHIAANWLRSDTLSRLRWHKEQGHRVGIVSASFESYLRPIGKSLGVDFVIASELEYDSDDQATGTLVDGNCRGPEKARRLRGWMSSNDLESAVIHAYGDSAGDRELLAMADHPCLVSKSPLDTKADLR